MSGLPWIAAAAASFIASTAPSNASRCRERTPACEKSDLQNPLPATVASGLLLRSRRPCLASGPNDLCHTIVPVCHLAEMP